MVIDWGGLPVTDIYPKRIPDLFSAKPVVVTRTAAVARGYHLEDGLNCRLVPPAAPAALEHAISDLLGDPERAIAVGARARETVVRHLSWRRYTDTIRELLLSACGPITVRA